jgi:hypothetical protein
MFVFKNSVQYRFYQNSKQIYKKNNANLFSRKKNYKIVKTLINNYLQNFTKKNKVNQSTLSNGSDLRIYLFGSLTEVIIVYFSI